MCEIHSNKESWKFWVKLSKRFRISKSACEKSLKMRCAGLISRSYFFYFLRHKQPPSFERTQCLFIVNKLSIKDSEVGIVPTVNKKHLKLHTLT